MKASRKARVEAEIARVELARLTIESEEIKQDHAKDVRKMNGERVEETVTCRASAIKEQTMFVQIYDTRINRINFITAERISARAQYNEALAALGCTVKARSGTKSINHLTLFWSRESYYVQFVRCLCLCIHWGLLDLRPRVCH